MTGSNGRARTRPRAQGNASSTMPAGAVASQGAGGGSGGKIASSGCEDIAEIVILMSPVPAVLATIAVHDELSVERDGLPVVAKLRGSTAGSIVTTDLVRLIACLDQGFKFSFTVLSIAGSQCKGSLRCLGR
jgi:hypothetical protein